MKTLVIATANKGKAQEFQALFADYPVTIKTLLDFPEIGEIEETGITFAENAALKAETVANLLNIPVLADDSGLIVDYLDGAPGVYSARYAGDGHDDKKNNKKLLKNLTGVPYEQRTARFHCTLAIAVPQQQTIFYSGEVSGYITEEERGASGFGYDPLFYLPNYQKTMAEIAASEKNKISHRANALAKLAKDIDILIQKID